MLQATVRHLKSCCSERSFTNAEVREFLTRESQDDGMLYTDDEYMLMFSDIDELPSEVAPLWLLDAHHVKEPLTLEGLTFHDEAGSYRRIHDLLDRLASVVFVGCDFYVEEMPFQRCFSRFKKCRFHHGWRVTTSMFGACSNDVFEKCEFQRKVVIDEEIYSHPVDCLSIFHHCKLDTLEVEGVRLGVDLFANLGSDISQLRELIIKDAVLERPLLLNQAQFERLHLQSSQLEDSLDLSHAKIQEVEFMDTIFEHAIAMNHGQISSLLMQRCDCRHVVDMGGCVLGELALNQRLSNEGSVRFAFTTFHQNVSFRDTQWNVPLDLRDTTQRQSIDFKGFELKVAARKRTDRETFRMIRHSFDAVGNHVDAGRCYALEMEAYRHEMHGQGQLAERFLLWCNSWMSYHGQSYLRPICWVVFGMLLFTLVRYAHQASWLYRIYLPANDALAAIAAGFNEVAQSLVIFKPLMVSGMEMLSLLFGLWFSTLTWQAVVAMRRHTRK